MVFVLLAIVGVSVLMTVLFRLSLRVVGRVVGERIDSQHRDVEYIFDTRRVPASWSSSDGRRLRRAELRNRPARRIATMKSRAKAAYAKRLDRSIAFFRTSPTVADPPTREMLLERLSAIREEWSSRSWEAITEIPASES